MRVDIPDPSALRSRIDSSSWSRVERFAIGFSCGYYLLVCLPWSVALFAGVPFGWWFDLGQWATAQVLGPPEHSSAASATASNVLTHYVSTLVFASFSAMLAIAWMKLDRRGTTHQVALAWLHAAVRFTLAACLMLYGWHKVLPGQFGRFATGGGTDYLIHQLGQLPPRDLLWAFMEGSRSYQVFTGLAELAAGFLLLTRRGAPAGGALGTLVMANVLMLDIAYDVVVKFFAAQLLLMAVFVTVPYLRGLPSHLSRHFASRSLYTRPLVSHRVVGRAVRAAGLALAIVLCVWSYRAAQRTVADNRAISETPLHGIWDVEAISRNGTAIPLLLTDATLWRRLVMPWAGTESGAIVVWMSDAVTRCRSRIDLKTRTLTIDPIAGSTVVGSSRAQPAALLHRQTFTFSTPLPDRMILSGTDRSGQPVVISLRRFDHASYALLTHRSTWRR